MPAPTGKVQNAIISALKNYSGFVPLTDVARHIRADFGNIMKSAKALEKKGLIIQKDGGTEYGIIIAETEASKLTIQKDYKPISQL